MPVMNGCMLSTFLFLSVMHWVKDKVHKVKEPVFNEHAENVGRIQNIWMIWHCNIIPYTQSSAGKLLKCIKTGCKLLSTDAYEGL